MTATVARKASGTRVPWTYRIGAPLLLIALQLILSDGLEEGASVKKARASSVDDAHAEPDQSLDERGDQRGRVPPGFLSPSVQEYLELGKSIPGRPGTDYPVLGVVPYTNFYCDEQEYPGFFADMDTRCQAWHYCDIDGRQATFLCPNGTQFSQAVFVCDWWFNVRCDLSPQLYAINARLYGTPKLSPTRPHRVIDKQLVEDIFT
ncbi:uncharacterized protein LOC117654223 [Thrips palmi]|uniref:Uncharacterized protein LOC117654223 n=1 Tax=Thrips palmi TaxID=161013 RepID=A0A6P9AGA6_THRPL|nr:uncharacterized protein LOC117654223 [Thrips palmi]